MYEPYENNQETEGSGVGRENVPQQPESVPEPSYTYSYSRPVQQPVQPQKKQSRPKGYWKRVIAGGLVFGILAGGVMFAVNAGLTALTGRGGPEETPIPQVEKVELSKGEATEQNGVLVAPGSVSEVAANAMPAMVAITSKTVQEVRSFFFGGTQRYESDASGSGIIVGQTDTELLIATNHHVVAGSEGLSVAFVDETAAQAQIKGTDAGNDLAVIAVKITDLTPETLAAIRVIEIGDSNTLVLGEQVVAIGNALGYGQSVTSGYVSALDREVTVESTNTMRLIQTDAAINPGNSGGALLNMRGQLIGINESKYAASGVEGMGYAIPVAIAEPILNDLMNRETRYKVDAAEAGYLGISCLSVSSEATTYYGMPAGAYISEVSPNSPADKGGLKQGDIITKMDGEAITSADALVERMTYYKKGEQVELTIQRVREGGYGEQVLTITLTGKPNQQAG